MSDSSRTDRFAWILPVVLVLAIGVQNVLTLQALREIRAVSAELQALKGRLSSETPAGGMPALQEGAAAPDFRYPDSSNLPTSLADFRGRPLLLVFSSPTCPYCQELYPELKRFAAAPSPREMEVLVLQMRSTPEENRALRQEQQLGFEVLAADTRTFMDYKVPATPFLVLVDGKGKVMSSGTASTYDQIVELTAPRT